MNDDDKVLSLDGKTSALSVPARLKRELLIGLGKTGRLKGAALAEYMKILEEESGDSVISRRKA